MMNVPRLFGIFVPSTGENHGRKSRWAGAVRHSPTSQARTSREVDDVFSNEMVELGIVAGLPVALEIITCALAQVLVAGDGQWARPAKRKSICRGNQESETKIGRIAGDIPI